MTTRSSACVERFASCLSACAESSTASGKFAHTVRHAARSQGNASARMGSGGDAREIGREAAERRSAAHPASDKSTIERRLCRRSCWMKCRTINADLASPRHSAVEETRRATPARRSISASATRQSIRSSIVRRFANSRAYRDVDGVKRRYTSRCTSR